MSFLRKALKVAAEIAVEQVATETFRGAAKDFGEALGADISRAYRTWRKLPDADKKEPESDD